MHRYIYGLSFKSYRYLLKLNRDNSTSMPLLSFHQLLLAPSTNGSTEYGCFCPHPMHNHHHQYTSMHPITSTIATIFTSRPYVMQRSDSINISPTTLFSASKAIAYHHLLLVCTVRTVPTFKSCSPIINI